MSFLTQLLIKYGSAAPVKVVERAPARTGPRNGVFTWEDVRQHCVPEDAWIVIENNVYDVTTYGSIHPGGDVLYSFAGKDATDAFNAFHKSGAPHVVLKSLQVGVLQDADTQHPAFLDDFRALRTQLQEEGFLQASFRYYIWKVMELVLLVTASLTLLYTGLAASSAVYMCISAVLMALFFTQCGWTQHDLNHNQVFRSRAWNEVCSFFVMNLGMGGCMHWWKTKHNQHHATPNALNDDYEAVDPDIDTIPLIAWSKELLQQVDPSSRMLIKVQHIIVWPLMTLAYVNWQMQGIIHVIMHHGVTQKQRAIELGTIALHFFWVLHAIFSNLSLRDSVLFFMFSHALSGFFTAFIFVQGHNGKEIYSGSKDFATAQVVTTRNITPSFFMDWFAGGLNYQIEHHLFPTMPRHSFPHVQERVRSLCEKHGLHYDMCSVAESTVDVYRCLEAMAKEHGNAE